MGIGSVMLFTILVHLRSEREYYDEEPQAKDIGGGTSEVLGPSGVEGYVHFPRVELELRAKDKWPPWRYNDIVGYLEVVCDASGTVKAYLYAVDAKRVSRRLVRKRFVDFGKYGTVSQS